MYAVFCSFAWCEEKNSASLIGVAKTHISRRGAEELENPERMYMMSVRFGS
jgi:hypothetical protein